MPAAPITKVAQQITTVENDVSTATITGNTQSRSVDVSRGGSLCIMCSGTFSTINCAFEASLDATNDTDGVWFAVQAVRTNANTIGTAVNVSEAGVSLTFQAIGTWTGSPTVTLRGSNKPNPSISTAADWFTLKTPDGSTAAFTADGGLSVRDLPLWVSPLVTSGTAGATIDLRVMAR